MGSDQLEQTLLDMAQLDMKGISKSFIAGKPVLKDINFDVASGEIHALAGANGSGKSTLVKILAGYHEPDAGGQISVGGNELPLPIHSHDVRLAGVRFVHQDNGFIFGMSVLDNLCLGRGYSYGLGWKIQWKRERESVEADLRRHNVTVDLDADARTLSVSTRAMLAIIRALHKRPGEEIKVVVLDEPTAAMGREEASGLGRWLRELVSKEDLGVLFIGHRPQEMREIADRISVLRNGELVATFRSNEVSNEDIVEALVGSEIGSFYPARSRQPGTYEPVFSARNVKGGSVADMSFSVDAGEIVGITGLQGSGFEELPYLLFDAERRAKGTLIQDGVEISLAHTTIASHLSRGIVFVPGDRINNSVVTDLTIRENISQPRLSQFLKRGLLRKQLEVLDAAGISGEFRVTPVGTEDRIGSLSGGNQQKVVLGKWLAMSPRVILLHEPTEGIDVAAKKEIFKILVSHAAKGTAILVSSIEYEDLAHICDRILVCGHGEIQIELNGRDVSGDDVVRAAYAASLTSDGGEAEQVIWSAS